MEEKVKLSLPNKKNRWAVAYIDEDTVAVIMDGIPFGPRDMAMKDVRVAAYSQPVYDALTAAGYTVIRAWQVAINLRMRAEDIAELNKHVDAQRTMSGLCTSIIREWLERQKNNKNNSNDA